MFMRYFSLYINFSDSHMVYLAIVFLLHLDVYALLLPLDSFQ
jgi:hypothetical protein